MKTAELTDSRQKTTRRAVIARAEGLFIKVFKGMASGSLILCEMLSQSIGQSGLFKFKNPGFSRA